MKTPEAVPELYSIPLDFARPISKTLPSLFVCTVPLAECSASTNLTFLNTSISYDTNTISFFTKKIVKLKKCKC
jgi:hypothetical protein